MKNKYNDDERKFLRENCKGKYTYEVAELFNKKFGKNVTAKEIHNWKIQNKVTSGIDTRFKKGCINPNPPKPLYSEMISYDKGRKITYIKVGKNKWEKKHLFLYKKYNGIIPKNSSIIFLDGNKDNFEKDNLICITREQHRIMAGNNLYLNSKELNETSIMIAQLKEKQKTKKEVE